MSSYERIDDNVNIEREPQIDSQNLYDLAYSEDIVRKGKAFGRYEYNGVLVPRVTSVIDYCYGDSENFKAYAAKLGEGYFSDRKRTLDIGTNVHAAIAEFLMFGTFECIRNLDEGRDEVYMCVRNFVNWYRHITEDLGWDVKIDLSEFPLICPWFAGTLDAIITINGRRYIIDFKSSKKISPEYFIQASAYLWIIDNYYPEYQPINGIGIVRIDKYNKVYEDVFFDRTDYNDAAYITQCQLAFGEALRLFYSMNILDHQTNTKCKEKKIYMENIDIDEEAS